MRLTLTLLLVAGCSGAGGGADAGASTGQPVWSDAWRTFTAIETRAMGVCGAQPSQWVVNLDTREVRSSGCFFDRTYAGTHTLSPLQFDALVAALRRLSSSSAQCIGDATQYVLQVDTLEGERRLEEATGACNATGTRVTGLEPVFSILASTVRQPMWNPSITSFTASQQVVFGNSCSASSRSTWSVDLAREELTWVACNFPSFESGSRALTAAEGLMLRAALEDVWRSSRTSCGADKDELLVTIGAPDGGTAQRWADDFYACRTDLNAVFVEGLDGVFTVLRRLSFETGADGGADAGFDAGPMGPAWPADGLRVDVLYLRSLLSMAPVCSFPDGGSTNRSTWSLDLDSGVIDFAVCFAEENLFVVDSGVLQPAQLDAFKTAADDMIFTPARTPPCSHDGDIDRFTIATPGGALILEDSFDNCPLPIGVFHVERGRAAREVLEVATHP